MGMSKAETYMQVLCSSLDVQAGISENPKPTQQQNPTKEKKLPLIPKQSNKQA